MLVEFASLLIEKTTKGFNKFGFHIIGRLKWKMRPLVESTGACYGFTEGESFDFVINQAAMFVEMKYRRLFSQ